MSNSFSYTLSQFKLDATTFCNMKYNYFYYIFQNHYQKGLDEKLLNTVSLAKDVLSNIENECSNFFVKDVVSLFVCKYTRFFTKHLHYHSCFSQYCNKWHMTDV